MDAKILAAVNQTIYSQHPYLNETSPEVTQLENKNSLLIYRGEVKTDSAFVLPIILRVVVDQNGKIVKITTSR